MYGRPGPSEVERGSDVTLFNSRSRAAKGEQVDGETVALAMSGLALTVSIVGTALVDRRSRASERLAIEARDDARATRTDALWSAYLESIHAVVSLDPTAEPVGEAWQRLRVTAMALVDGLPD